jgi:hypothetical protein
VWRERRRIGAHYAACSPSSIVLPPDATKRQFRLALRHRDGRQSFVKVEDRVRDPAKLLLDLARRRPHHVYYTTSTWLDPQRLGPRDLRKARRAGFAVAHNVFLDQGLYFDIDVEGDLATAAHHLVVLRDLLADRWGFSRFRAVYSGSKGFHLYVEDFRLRDFVEEVPARPSEREDLHPVVKAQFTQAALEEGVAVDAGVTLDPRRILRLPGTVHGKTLNLCEVVDLARVESYVPRTIPSEGLLRALR